MLHSADVKTVFVLLAVAAGGFVVAGCQSSPHTTPQGQPQPETAPPPASPEPSLARLEPARPPTAELPEPSVKLVDLRRLRIGMTMEEVLAIFPGPVETRISPRDTIVWRYRFAELYFRDGKLYNWFDLEREY